VWSQYGTGSGAELTRFVRVGTLDETRALLPDVHIFTRDRLPWVVVPSDVKAFEGFYDFNELWAREVDERRYAMLLEIQAAAAAQGEGSEGP
jgi:hypothetical protein